MAAGRDGLVLLLGVTVGAVVVTTSGTTTVELDAVALAGDAVSLAGAGAAVRAGGAVAGRGRAGGAGREGRADGRDGGGAEVLVVESSGAEAGSELLKSSLVVLSVENVLGGAGRDGLGGLDLRNGKGAALGDLRRGRALGRALGGGLGGGLGGRLGGRLGGSGDVEDVEGSASGGLNGGADGRVVGDVVTVDDVVVPVSLASLEGGGLEAEGTLPGAGLGGGLVLGERELAGVVVPRAEKVDGLDTGRNAKRERELDSRHFDL